MNGPPDSGDELRRLIVGKLRGLLAEDLSTKFVDANSEPLRGSITAEHVVELILRQLESRDLAAPSLQSLLAQVPKQPAGVVAWLDDQARGIAQREIWQPYVRDCKKVADCLAETTPESRRGEIIDGYRQDCEPDLRFFLESMLEERSPGRGSRAGVDEAWDFVRQEVFLTDAFLGLARTYRPERGRTFASFLWKRVLWRGRDAVRRVLTRPDRLLDEAPSPEEEPEDQDWFDRVSAPDKAHEVTPERLEKIRGLLEKCLHSLSSRPLRGLDADQRRQQRAVFDLTYKLYIPPELAHAETCEQVGRILRAGLKALEAECRRLSQEMADCRKTLSLLEHGGQSSPRGRDQSDCRQAREKLRTLTEQSQALEWQCDLVENPRRSHEEVGRGLIQHQFETVDMLFSNLTGMKLEVLARRLDRAREVLASYQRQLEQRQTPPQRLQELRRQAVGRIQDFLDDSQAAEPGEEGTRPETLFIVACLRYEKARRAQEEALTQWVNFEEMNPPWVRSRDEVKDLLQMSQPTVSRRLKDAWTYLKAKATGGSFGVLEQIGD